MALVADQFKGVDHYDLPYYSHINNKRDYSIISTHTYNAKEFTPRIDPFVELILDKGIEIPC